MTSTELKYWELQENQRHNKATEEAAAALLSETNRSNLMNEQIRSNANAETNRSNLAKERLGYLGQMETNRSNLANEQIATVLNGIRNSELDLRQYLGELQNMQISRQSDIKVTEIASRAEQFQEDLELRRFQVNETLARSDLDRAQRETLVEQQRQLDRDIAELKAFSDQVATYGRISTTLLQDLMRSTGQGGAYPRTYQTPPQSRIGGN